MGIKLILVLLFGVSWVVPLHGQDSPQTMQWNWISDKSYAVKINHDTTTRIDAGSRDITTQVKSTTWLNFNIVSVDAEGVADFQITVKRISVDSVGPGGNNAFDSQNSAEDIEDSSVAQSALPMIDRSATGRIDQAGRIMALKVDVDVPAKMVVSLDNLFRSILTKICPQLPNEPIEPEFSWQRKIEEDTVRGKINLTQNWVYRGKVDDEDKTAHEFGVSSEMDIDNPNAEIRELSSQGTVRLATNRSRIDRSETTQKLRMTVSQNGVDRNIEVDQIEVIIVNLQ